MKKLIDRLFQDSIEYIVNWKKHFKEYLWAIVIVLIIRSSLGVIYRIPTTSMIPTFREGDILLGNRFYYGLRIPFTDEKTGPRLPAVRNPEIGDVVIIRGPREEVFYNLLINYRTMDKKLLNEINQASAFKGIIGKNVSSLIDDVYNYIILEYFGEQVVLHLHEKVYQKYKEKIEKQLKVISSIKEISVMNYNFPLEQSFLKKFLSTPLTGASIIATVIFNSPFFIFYETGARLLFTKDGQAINFYPNRYIDNTKEYVKRYIAKAGDTVEIKNKVLYVNGQIAAPSSNYEIDPFINSFRIYEENLPQSEKSKAGQVFKHPLRLGEESFKPRENFDSQAWPFEPETLYASNFRDYFGPITVPPGHIFVLGDNRDQSLDSRYIGAVPKWALKGSPIFIFYPWNRKGRVR